VTVPFQPAQALRVQYPSSSARGARLRLGSAGRLDTSTGSEDEPRPVR